MDSKKRPQAMDMNWQAKQAAAKLAGERPEEQVRLLNHRLQAHMVVKHLKEDRNERTKKTPAGHTIYLRNTDFQTIAQVKERTHVDIAGDDSVCRDVRERLEAHPKIEWGGNDKDRLRYKPEFDEIRNMGQLRELIMKFEFGIARERLVDCYAAQKVAEDIAALEREGHILVIKNDEQPPKEQLYPLSPMFRLEVSPRVVDAWRAVRLPQTDTDLDKEMQRQGLQDAAPRAVTQAFKRPIQKKPKKQARRGQHTVNKHLLDTKLR